MLFCNFVVANLGCLLLLWHSAAHISSYSHKISRINSMSLAASGTHASRRKGAIECPPDSETWHNATRRLTLARGATGRIRPVGTKSLNFQKNFEGVRETLAHHRAQAVGRRYPRAGGAVETVRRAASCGPVQNDRLLLVNETLQSCSRQNDASLETFPWWCTWDVVCAPWREGGRSQSGRYRRKRIHLTWDREPFWHTDSLRCESGMLVKERHP